MPVQFTPYALLALANALVALGLAYFIWRKRPGRAVVPFTILMLALALWSFASALALLAVIPQWILAFNALSFLGVAIVPSAWLACALEYTGRERYLTRRTVGLMALHPTLVMLAIITNPLHNLWWTSITPVEIEGVISITRSSGILFWVHAGISYVILLVGAVFMIRAFVLSPEVYRGQIVQMLIGVFTPWIANGIYLAGFSPLPSFVDITPLAFTVTGFALAYSLYRYQLLDLVPVARTVVFDSMGDAVFVLDTKNRLADANKKALDMFGVGSEIIGQSAETIFSEQAEAVARYRDVEEAEDEIELTINGRTRHFTLTLSPLKDQQGVVSGRTIILHDITALKEANRALADARERADEATRLKSQFLATMSHELRTPLNAVIGYTELQLTGMVGELSDIQYEYGERVLLNAHHLLGLINDVLDISKIEAGRMKLVLGEFALHDWVDSITMQNRVLAEEKGLDFVVEVDDSLPTTMVGDATRLQQIVVNLLGNAFKFTSEGRVTLQVMRDGEQTWKIIVCDTGIGIPPHKQETIFEEFQQADGSETRAYGGTGLGLAIVRKLALLMGGTIRLDSVMDEGSTFTVILPLRVDVKQAIA